MNHTTIEMWRAFGNAILSPVERVKDQIRSSIEKIREKWPEWEHGNDARWAWFTGAKKLLQTYQLGCVFIRDHLADAQWWKQRALDYDETQIPDHMKEFNVFQTYGLSNGLFTITEESLRLIVRALDQNAGNQARDDFKNIYEYLLSCLSLNIHKDLFDLHRLIRNTIHTNGVFRPRNGQDQEIVFEGELFRFRDSQKIDFVNIELLLRMTSHYNAALMNIVSSGPVSELRRIERFQ